MMKVIEEFLLSFLSLSDLPSIFGWVWLISPTSYKILKIVHLLWFDLVTVGDCDVTANFEFLGLFGMSFSYLPDVARYLFLFFFYSISE